MSVFYLGALSPMPPCTYVPAAKAVCQDNILVEVEKSLEEEGVTLV